MMRGAMAVSLLRYIKTVMCAAVWDASGTGSSASFYYILGT
jgi:hypothetical protein